MPGMVLAGQGLTFMSRENSFNLRKNGIAMVRGSKIIFVNIAFANSL